MDNQEYNKPFTQLYQASSLVRTPWQIKTLAKWSAGLFVTLVVVSFFPWTQNITTKGKVTTLYPEERPQSIHSTIAGRIEHWYVHEGDQVKKGDTILSLSEVKDKFFDPDLLLRIDEQIQAKEGVLSSYRKKVDALVKQIGALQDGLKYSLEKAKNKVKQMELKVQSDSVEFYASAKTENQIAERQMQGIEELYKKGLKSLTEFENARAKYQQSLSKLQSAENKFFSSRNELYNAKIELNSIESDYLDKISKAESELSSTLSYLYETEGNISKMNNEYANMQIRSSFYYITAPQDGYVVKALRMGIGETIKEGEAIASIMPGKVHTAVELYVKAMDLPLIQKGNHVRLQFDGWPTMVFSGWPGASFGTFGGRIAVIDNIDTEGSYRILVEPDPREKDHPWPASLRVGSGVEGWAMLTDVPIWYEVWRHLNGFPPDYTHQLPGAAAKEKSKEDKVEGKSEELE